MARNAHIRRLVLIGACAVVLLAGARPLSAGAAPVFDYANYHPYEARIPAHTSTLAFGMSGRFGVVIDAGGAIEVYDFADEAGPRIVCRATVSGYLEYAAVSGRFLVVGRREDSSEGAPSMCLYEIGDDGCPALRASQVLATDLWHTYAARGVVAWGDLCLVGGYRWNSYGYVFIRRVTGSGVEPLETLTVPGYPLALAMCGNRLFVSSSYGGIAWYDLTPECVVTQSGVLDFGAACRSLVLVGDMLVAVEPDGTLDIVRAAAAGGPVLISRTAIGGTANQLAVRGDQAFVADAGLGLRQLDLADPLRPVVTDTLWTTAGATHVTAMGRCLAAAVRADGVEIIDPNATYVGPLRHVVPWLCGAFAVRGSLVFGAGIVDGRQCAVLVDVADAAAPRVLGTWPHDWGALGGQWATLTDSLAVLSSTGAGTIMYGWDAVHGLTGAVPLTFPGAPLAMGVFRGRDLFTSYSLSGGDYWWIGAEDFPRITSQPMKMFYPGSLCASPGGLLWGSVYQSLDACQLSAWDVSNPGTLQLRATNDLPGRVTSLMVSDDQLYAGGIPSRVLDVSRPDAVTALAELPGIDGATAMARQGDLLCARAPSGIGLFDVADIRAPRWLGRALGPLPCVGMNDHWLLAGGNGGLMFLARPVGGGGPTGTPPPALQGGQLLASPNPFNPQLRISLVLGKAGPVDLTVFDLRGRRVASLLHGVAGPGRLAAAWDGRDAAGQAAPSGSYVVRASTPDGVTTRTVTLAR